jgi:hypothetical protein
MVASSYWPVVALQDDTVVVFVACLCLFLSHEGCARDVGWDHDVGCDSDAGCGCGAGCGRDVGCCHDR